MEAAVLEALFWILVGCIAFAVVWAVLCDLVERMRW